MYGTDRYVLFDILWRCLTLLQAKAGTENEVVLPVLLPLRTTSSVRLRTLPLTHGYSIISTVEYPFPPVGIVGAADGKNRRAFFFLHCFLPVADVDSRAAETPRVVINETH